MHPLDIINAIHIPISVGVDLVDYNARFAVSQAIILDQIILH
ncbi:MAG: hypothetical protein ACJARX_000083 [Psychroserpens sp.]|jgi:hypothetical protein